MAKLIIEINTDNAAFQPVDGRAAQSWRASCTTLGTFSGIGLVKVRCSTAMATMSAAIGTRNEPRRSL